jgi:hypothetical protein
MTRFPDNLLFDLGFGEFRTRAKGEDRRHDNLIAIVVRRPKFNVGTLRMGVILSVHESKQHRQALGREEAYHKKEAPAQWSHRGFQVEKMLAGSQPFDAIRNNVAPR